MGLFKRDRSKTRGADAADEWNFDASSFATLPQDGWDDHHGMKSPDESRRVLRKKGRSNTTTSNGTSRKRSNRPRPPPVKGADKVLPSPGPIYGDARDRAYNVHPRKASVPEVQDLSFYDGSASQVNPLWIQNVYQNKQDVAYPAPLQPAKQRPTRRPQLEQIQTQPRTDMADASNKTLLTPCQGSPAAKSTTPIYAFFTAARTGPFSAAAGQETDAPSPLTAGERAMLPSPSGISPASPTGANQPPTGMQTRLNKPAPISTTVEVPPNNVYAHMASPSTPRSFKQRPTKLVVVNASISPDLSIASPEPPQQTPHRQNLDAPRLLTPAYSPLRSATTPATPGHSPLRSAAIPTTPGYAPLNSATIPTTPAYSPMYSATMPMTPGWSPMPPGMGVPPLPSIVTPTAQRYDGHGWESEDGGGQMDEVPLEPEPEPEPEAEPEPTYEAYRPGAKSCSCSCGKEEEDNEPEPEAEPEARETKKPTNHPIFFMPGNGGSLFHQQTIQESIKGRRNTLEGSTPRKTLHFANGVPGLASPEEEEQDEFPPPLPLVQESTTTTGLETRLAAAHISSNNKEDKHARSRSEPPRAHSRGRQFLRMRGMEGVAEEGDEGEAPDQRRNLPSQRRDRSLPSARALQRFRATKSGRDAGSRSRSRGYSREPETRRGREEYRVYERVGNGAG